MKSRFNRRQVLKASSALALSAWSTRVLSAAPPAEAVTSELIAVQMLSEPTHGRIVRPMNERDRAEARRLAALEQGELEACDRFVQQRRLLMEMVDLLGLYLMALSRMMTSNCTRLS